MKMVFKSYLAGRGGGTSPGWQETVKKLKFPRGISCSAFSAAGSPDILTSVLDAGRRWGNKNHVTDLGEPTGKLLEKMS